MLFEVAILRVPTKKEIEGGTAQETLLLSPTTVIAKDRETAAMRAVMQNSSKITEADLTHAQVLVRPFA